jgi:hypothetical protein
MGIYVDVELICKGSFPMLSYEFSNLKGIGIFDYNVVTHEAKLLKNIPDDEYQHNYKYALAALYVELKKSEDFSFIPDKFCWAS